MIIVGLYRQKLNGWWWWTVMNGSFPCKLTVVSEISLSFLSHISLEDSCNSRKRSSWCNLFSDFTLFLICSLTKLAMNLREPTWQLYCMRLRSRCSSCKISCETEKSVKKSMCHPDSSSCVNCRPPSSLPCSSCILSLNLTPFVPFCATSLWLRKASFHSISFKLKARLRNLQKFSQTNCTPSWIAWDEDDNVKRMRKMKKMLPSSWHSSIEGVVCPQSSWPGLVKEIPSRDQSNIILRDSIS